MQFNTALYDAHSTAHIAVLEVQLNARNTPTPASGCLRHKATNSSGISYTIIKSRFFKTPRSPSSLLSLCIATDRLQSRQNTTISSISFVAPSYPSYCSPCLSSLELIISTLVWRWVNVCVFSGFSGVSVWDTYKFRTRSGVWIYVTGYYIRVLHRYRYSGYLSVASDECALIYNTGY
jgi:hypothetical protein